MAFLASDSMVTESLFWYGIQGYEGPLGDLWVALCREARAPLEIGGNVGLYAVIGAKASSHPYTVLEPVPGNAAILRRNAELNAVANLVVVEAAAIADDQEHPVVLNIPPEGREAPVGAFLSASLEVGRRNSHEQISVRGLPFRTLTEHSDLIKIDAEGIEVQLLSAAHPAMWENHATLVVEVLPEATELATWLASCARRHGYRLFVVPAYGSDEIVEIDPALFTSSTPAQYRSKDVVLSTRDIRELPVGQRH